MEGAARSEVARKKKSSDGCLIVKSRGANSSHRRRARLVTGSSTSSDEEESLEFMRRKINGRRMNNGSEGYKKNKTATTEQGRGIVGITGYPEAKSRLDLFEFDEYDEFDGQNMCNKFSGCGSMRDGNSGSSHLKESGVCSSSKDLVAKKPREALCFSGTNGGRGKGLRYRDKESKECGDDNDDNDIPISLLRSKYQRIACKPIRLQGKNGVLKVMVDKKKKIVVPLHPTNSQSKVAKEKISFKNDGFAVNDLVPEVDYPVQKEHQNQVCDGEYNENDETVRSSCNEEPCSHEKATVVTGSKYIRTMSKLTSSCVQASTSMKEMTKGDAKSSLHEQFSNAKFKMEKEGKTKRGGSTEKQKLRDHIQGMLVGAGWSIDYRKRRNRDYLDAVYINPSGTAYWSIIKAYDALRKHLEKGISEINAEVSPATFAPLSDELINKLTRQTRKKISGEKKRKRKEGGVIHHGKKYALADESSETDQDERQLSSCVKQNGKSLKGKRCKVYRDCVADRDDHSIRIKLCNHSAELPLKASGSISIQEGTSKFIGRCTLMVRGADKEETFDSDRFLTFDGKRTVLAWLIDSGVAKLSEKVQYLNRRKSRAMLEGWITREGIHCACCSKILTVSKFELHAGSKMRQPFQNIYLESGTSLLQCQLDAWNSQDESLRQDFHFVDADGDDPDDDTCSTCGDGGDLMCCDSCPSTFHQSCLGIQMLPSGDWHCPNCACIFCGHYGNGNDAEEKDIATYELKKCIFCEKKYHKRCSEKVHVRPPSLCDASFCGQKCQELHDHLQKILGIKQELEAGFTWSLIQRKDLSDSSHHGFPLRVEGNSKLAVALSVMDECFLPIVDHRSGVNMIHSVVYNCGSNFNRLNYCGFYTVVLERGDEIISAASIRLHGNRIAEMPFIATRQIYRRQGMCKRLFSAIESELCSLKVRRLIIPAIPEHMNTWTKVFGFHELEDADKKEVKFLNMLVFPGTDMLQKQLLKQEVYDGQVLSDSVIYEPQLPDLKKCNADSFLGESRPKSITCGEVHISLTKFNTHALDSEAFSLNHKEADNALETIRESVSAPTWKIESNPELKNKGKNSLFSTKTSNSFDLENQLTNAYPVGAIIDDAFMADVSLESNLDHSGGHVIANEACRAQVEEKSVFPDKHSDDVPVVTSNDSFLGELSVSSPEISAQKTEDRVNGEFISTFCSSTFMNDAASVSESWGHSSTDISSGINVDGAAMPSPEKSKDDEKSIGGSSRTPSYLKPGDAILEGSATTPALAFKDGTQH